MSFASTGKTGLFLLILVGRIFPFYVELFFRFLFLLLGGICLFAIVVLSVCPSTSVNRVYSFCHCNASAKKKCASGESRPRPGARRSPGSPRTPGASVFSIHCPLAPTALQHLSFLLFSLRIRPQSAPPPDAIHLPPSLLPAPDHPPYLLHSLRTCVHSALSPDIFHLSPSPFPFTP